MTVLLFCMKTYENLRFWKVEVWKTMTVLLFYLKTNENIWFWKVEEHHAQVLDTPGLANLCWHQVRSLQGSFRASEPELIQVRWHQDQQTCVGAYKRQCIFFVDGKRTFWMPGQTLNDN